MVFVVVLSRLQRYQKKKGRALRPAKRLILLSAAGDQFLAKGIRRVSE